MISYLLSHPSCLLGPAIWLSKEHSARYHRHLFIHAWPNRPRWQWFLLLFANVLCWYVFLGWRSVFHSVKTSTQDQNNWDLSTPGFFFRLCYLTFWVGAPAEDFVRFGLNRAATHRWLDYVYSCEEISWQRVFSCPADSPSADLLRNKYQFEHFLQAEGIPSTKTLCVIDRHKRLSETDLWQKSLPVFIKPVSANAMRGCLLLQEEDSVLVLQGKNLQGEWVQIHGKDRVLELISKMAEDQPVLVQEVLENAIEMQAYAGTQELVTLRLISGLQAQDVVLAYGILEIPKSEQGSWDLQSISRSGESVLLGPIPDFDAAWKRVRELHLKMTDVKTIAWDLCLTEGGWTVLEGNTGWGLVSPQMVSGTPLLKSGLQDCYQL